MGDVWFFEMLVNASVSSLLFTKKKIQTKKRRSESWVKSWDNSLSPYLTSQTYTTGGVVKYDYTVCR